MGTVCGIHTPTNVSPGKALTCERETKTLEDKQLLQGAADFSLDESGVPKLYLSKNALYLKRVGDRKATT